MDESLERRIFEALQRGNREELRSCIEIAEIRGCDVTSSLVAEARHAYFSKFPDHRCSPPVPRNHVPPPSESTFALHRFPASPARRRLLADYLIASPDSKTSSFATKGLDPLPPSSSIKLRTEAWLRPVQRQTDETQIKVTAAAATRIGLSPNPYRQAGWLSVNHPWSSTPSNPSKETKDFFRQFEEAAASPVRHPNRPPQNIREMMALMESEESEARSTVKQRYRDFLISTLEHLANEMESMQLRTHRTFCMQLEAQEGTARGILVQLERDARRAAAQTVRRLSEKAFEQAYFFERETDRRSSLRMQEELYRDNLGQAFAKTVSGTLWELQRMKRVVLRRTEIDDLLLKLDAPIAGEKGIASKMEPMANDQ